jgi:surface polysaccharide O-acyltransferase-like enzyme
MKTNKIIGGLFIAGAIALFIPYNILIVIFEYPDILRQPTAIILSKFHEGGDSLIWTWFAFAITGIPLLPAYILLGQKLERKTSLARMATTIGVIGLIVQMIGLLRWTFVVPVLADSFVNASDEATKVAAVIAFKTIHQFGGVILGEHLGQHLP